ncbi:hypothetical protein AABB24_006681 [Solanum stoloniferum]
MAASSSSSRLVRAVGRSLFSGLCNNADGLMRSTHEMMCNHLLFQETQIQVTMYGKDITHYEREFVPFQTYLLSMAYVTESTKAYGNPLHELTWTIGKGTIVEPIEQVIPPEPPLLPPTLLKVTSFDSFDYQAIGFKFGTSQHIFTLYLRHILSIFITTLPY